MIRQRFEARWRHVPFLVAPVVAVLIAGAFSLVFGTVLGLANFRDVGYPDSAILLRVGEFVRSGHIYPAIDRPPYMVTVYGPLTYVLLGIPYWLADTAGVNPVVPVRLVVVAALCACVWLIFLMSRRLYTSRGMSWLCVLFAVSASPLSFWTTQIRGDLLAVGFSLTSVYSCLRGKGRLQLTGTAICAGIAVLVKQTFVAAPVAITCWLIYRRRYQDAAVLAAVFALTVAAGYAFALWREPLMLNHLAALRHPVFEYKGAVEIVRNALGQPVVLFAAAGGVLVLSEDDGERLLLLIYCGVAWLVAMLTIPQAGGNINYFWEPLLVSAVLAGPGLVALQRQAQSAPILVAAMLCVLLFSSLVPTLREDVVRLTRLYRHATEYQARKTKWNSFVAAVSGRRLLSTLPAVTVHAVTPEIPDPYLNAMLERGGTWNSGPVIAQIDAGTYELIVIEEGQADKPGGYRGIRTWSVGMWSAMKRSYRPACAFERMEVWLPQHGAGEILPSLSAIGCRPVATRLQNQTGQAGER